jgi:hypothetical protein
MKQSSCFYYVVFVCYLYYGFPICLANSNDTEQWYGGKNKGNNGPAQNLSPLREDVLAVIVRQNIQINQVKDPNPLCQKNNPIRITEQ